MRTIALTPHLKGHKYERYMENWGQLARPQSRRAKNAAGSEDNRRSAMTRLTQRILKRLEGLDR
jgi:hypothetical protein